MSKQIVFRGFTSHRPFGVELEVNEKVSKSDIKKIIAAEDPIHPVHVEGGWAKSIKGDMWHVKRDGTCGHEIASYKMSGYQDIQNVGNVADALRRRGVQVDERCGLHVHADLSDYTLPMMGVLLGNWLRIEPVILQACPSHRRKNKHCRSMREKYDIDNREAVFNCAQGLYYELEPGDLGDHNNEEKRVTLNIVPYVIHRHNPSFTKNTAEIRMPEGTLNKSDVQNWVRLYLHFVEASKHQSLPQSLKKANLAETLQILDLRGSDSTFYLLGKDLYETKKWFLKRVAKHTEDPVLYKDAMNLLNEMSQPVETHTRLHRIFQIPEPIGAI